MLSNGDRKNANRKCCAMSVNPLATPKGLKLLCELCQKPAHVQCINCRVTYYWCVCVCVLGGGEGDLVVGLLMIRK